MPVCIPDALPAAKVLASENIFVMTRQRSTHQDIRPLHIAVPVSYTHLDVYKRQPSSPICPDYTMPVCRFASELTEVFHRLRGEGDGGAPHGETWSNFGIFPAGKMSKRGNKKRLPCVYILHTQKQKPEEGR